MPQSAVAAETVAGRPPVGAPSAIATAGGQAWLFSFGPGRCRALKQRHHHAAVAPHVKAADR